MGIIISTLCLCSGFKYGIKFYGVMRVYLAPLNISDTAEMSSVLYPMTHSNGANPIGNQVRALQQTIADLRKVVDTQTGDIVILKAQVTAAINAATAASVAATAAKTAVDALPKTAATAATTATTTV
jgi:hypothetical protein